MASGCQPVRQGVGNRRRILNPLQTNELGLEFALECRPTDMSAPSHDGGYGVVADVGPRCYRGKGHVRLYPG